VKTKLNEFYALEQLASGNTCIHRLNPLVKLLAAVVFIVTVVSFNRYALGRLIPFIFYPALLMSLSQTPFAMLFKRFLIALPFCLFAGISNVIFDRSAAFAPGGITISWGFISLASILFKTWLCVIAVLLLVSVTRFSDLTNELRRLHLPAIFVVMFELTYRYAGVLLNEAHSMSIAYSLRSPKRKGVEIKDMGSFTGLLLLRSFDRADRVYNAMKCRGYALQNTPRGKRLVLKDVIYLLAVCLFCVTLRFVDVNAMFAGILEGLYHAKM
jgi:cobalt/nickel transport system permease protein